MNLVNGAIIVAFSVAVTWSWNTLVGAGVLGAKVDERKEARDHEIVELRERFLQEVGDVRVRVVRLEDHDMTRPAGCTCGGN